MRIAALVTFTLLATGMSTRLAHAAPGNIVIDLGRGPVNVHVPTGYDPQNPAPLVMLLHGYTSSGQETEDVVQFTPLADQYGFIYLFPDGQTDILGSRYWNATQACCDFFGNADDSGYLLSLIEEVENQLSVDPRRIYVTGHSNGGFMAYRMACDHAGKVAAGVGAVTSPEKAEG